MRRIFDILLLAAAETVGLVTMAVRAIYRAAIFLSCDEDIARSGVAIARIRTR